MQKTFKLLKLHAYVRLKTLRGLAKRRKSIENLVQVVKFIA